MAPDTVPTPWFSLALGQPVNFSTVVCLSGFSTSVCHELGQDWFHTQVIRGPAVCQVPTQETAETEREPAPRAGNLSCADEQL